MRGGSGFLDHFAVSNPVGSEVASEVNVGSANSSIEVARVNDEYM